MSQPPPIRRPDDTPDAVLLAELGSFGRCLGLGLGLSASAPDASLAQALRLATRLCGASDGSVAIIDRDDVRIVARLGCRPAGTATDDELARFCVARGTPIIAADARLVPALAAYPQVWAEGGLRFCALIPLVTARGSIIGALSVTDSVPRPDLGIPAQAAPVQAALVDLAGLIVETLEQRRQARINEEFASRAALVQRLMSLAADAADFPSAVAAATRALCESTGGKLCLLWRLGAKRQRAFLLCGHGVGVFGTEDYLKTVANIVNDDPQSPTILSMVEERQIVVEDLLAGSLGRLPLMRLGAAHGLMRQISTPLRLGEERFALVLALADDSADLPTLAATLTVAAGALRPLLRRIRDEDQNRLLQRVVDETSDVVLITEAEPIDLPGPRIVFANPAFEKQTGYTAAEVLGLTPRILQGPESSPHALANIRSALSNWQPVRQTLLNYRKDGTSFWSDLQITPIADAQGWFTHLVAIQRDVTEEREAQRARNQAVHELNQLIAQMPGTLIRLLRGAGGAWRPRYVAPSILELTGYTPEESSAEGWFTAHVEPETQIRNRRESDQAALGAHLTSLFRLRHKDGRWLWIRSIKRGQVAADGVSEVVSIWSDVTLERHLADQLAHAARLTQLGEVTTGLAHELNQPLASISLAAENAARHLAAQPQALDRALAKLALIVEQTQRASAVIDHMRQFGRIEAEAMTPVRLTDVLARAATMLQGKLDAGGITLASDGLATFPPVLAAAIPLEQVLINLIVNACDAYAGAGTGLPRRIDIRAWQADDVAQITVSDQAGGIPDEVLPRIFQPFFTTKPAGQGTGLGLSISYGILAAMGGKITAANVDGGARFTITLPLAGSP